MSEPRATILQFPLGPLQTNTYILVCKVTGKAAVIDPAWSGQLICDRITQEGWQLDHILLTHSHFDHVGGLSELKAATGAPIAVHHEAVPMLQNAAYAGQLWQITVPEPPAPDTLLYGDETIAVGDLNLSVLNTPGHAPGHICFYLASEGVVFDGDVLFQQGIGRTDLPGGDYEELMQSIRHKLLVLPDDTLVLSGHGQATTIGQEKQTNPFLTDIRD